MHFQKQVWSSYEFKSVNISGKSVQECYQVILSWGMLILIMNDNIVNSYWSVKCLM